MINNIYDLKIIPRYYYDIKNNNKRFEVRFNDREYKVGDLLLLRELTTKWGYTNNKILARITYILDDSKYCKDNYVILGFELVDAFNECFKCEEDKDKHSMFYDATDYEKLGKEFAEELTKRIANVIFYSRSYDKNKEKNNNQ